MIFVYTAYVPERHIGSLTPNKEYVLLDQYGNPKEGDAHYCYSYIIDDVGKFSLLCIPMCAFLDTKAWNVRCEKGSSLSYA